MTTDAKAVGGQLAGTPTPLAQKLPGLLKEAGFAALVALALTITMVGLHLVHRQQSLVLEFRIIEVVLAVATVFVGRLGLSFAREGYPAITLAIGAALIVFFLLPLDLAAELGVLGIMAGGVLGVRALLVIVRQQRPQARTQRQVMDDFAAWVERRAAIFGLIGLVAAIALPWLFPNRSMIDLATLVLLYIMLGWGLNIIVGLAGLLDLGYVAFYAVGAYSFALLSLYFGLDFWICLPVAAILAAFAGLMLGFPVLRLRGDYFAIVTLGFGEIIRIILENWSEFTGGPDGIRSIPDPSFFGFADFTPEAGGGLPAFHEVFGLEYSPLQRIIFLYYLILVLALAVNFVSVRLRRQPLGRSWEALREDDVACQSLGINRRNIKLAAFVIAAAIGGIAGSFFATRQGFISPESFKFIESAVILAIVVLGGMGSQIGIVLAAILLIGGPEFAREFEEYRMLIFGAGMVAVMVWRPRGLLAHREPTVKLGTGDPPPPSRRVAESTVTGEAD
ncbi:MAG: high-affinity branched-chain amino acid ABC transporter permease LivM [Azospirillaceae bacterium]